MNNADFFALYNGRRVKILAADKWGDRRFNIGDIGTITLFSANVSDYHILVMLDNPQYSGLMEFNYTELELIKDAPLPLPG